jgi:hypothetical protein
VEFRLAPLRNFFDPPIARQRPAAIPLIRMNTQHMNWQFRSQLALEWGKQECQ